MAENLMLFEGNCDVILKVRHEGYSWRMPAHSLLLVNKSSIFQEMLDERTEDEKPTPLFLHGVKPETALAVLKYIYSDEYPVDVTADLFVAAQKYNLPALRDNLEERFMSDMTLISAIKFHEGLQLHQSNNGDCIIKSTCLDMMLMYSLTVFGSDLVMLLGKRTLVQLLQSNELNIPDEAFAFWGIWRWGRRFCSRLDKILTDENVAVQIDDLIVHIRACTMKNRHGIPEVARARFDRCKGRRTNYFSPPDILRHASSLRPCPTWQNIISPKKPTESGAMCIQMSFEKDVLLVGMTLEMCIEDSNRNSKLESHLQLIRESDCTELRRQRICWCTTELLKTSVKSDPEVRLEDEVILKEPIFLTKGNIYSIYIYGNFSHCFFVWASIRNRRMKVGNTFVNLHGEGVTAVREMYFIPDVSVTWGPRGPDY